jgi:predicted DNA-binding transcriptional regulator YafY
MKSDRLISLLLLLQARSPRSARELSETLEVSMRTVYRDVEALSFAGVPVYAERGSAGGILLAEGYRQAITQFSTDELHALFLAAADPLTELGVSGHKGALHKLAGALPDLQRRAAEQARQRILLDHNKWYRAQQPGPLLAALRRAVWDDRRVRIHYRDRNGTPTERVVDPLGLVSKAGIWYLIARQENGEMRTFRAERILQADELPAQFTRPADFDLEAHWRSSMSAVERPVDTYDVLLFVAHDELEMITGFYETQVVSEEPDGKTVRVRFPGQRVALWQVAGWGARVRAIDPPDLRTALIEHAHEMLRAYCAPHS